MIVPVDRTAKLNIAYYITLLMSTDIYIYIDCN